jgi:transposase
MAWFRLMMTTLVETLVPKRVVGDPRAAAAARAWCLVRRPDPYRPRSPLFRGDRVHGWDLDPWRLLPIGELACGSEATVRRRLVEWSSAGVFERLHDQLLDRRGAKAWWTGRGRALTP